MKKINGEKVCYGISLLLLIGFVVRTIVDYSRYNATLNSAPLSVWIAANAITFLVPAAVAVVVALVIRKKQKLSGEK